MTAPDFDAAIAALRVWAIEVDVGDRTYRIPPLPASRWWEAVLSKELGPIVPGMLEPEDEEEVVDALFGGVVSVQQLTTANREALAAASGWKWWVAERLIVSAAAEWRVIGGLLQGAGIDLERVSIGAALSAMYAMAVTNMKKEDRFQFDSQLNAPPIGYADAREWYDESAYADVFADLLAAHRQALPAGGKATGT